MDAKQLPLDRTSADALNAEGLRLELVDGTNREELAAWDEADYRGFHDRRPEPEAIDEHVRHTAHRRIVGVWDDGIPEPNVPVATVSTWVGDLTVPGGATLESWAISSVTVAPTHRRRGVARAMLEGELRTAAAAGVPMASLTVSEATIYQRYGFGPATQTADLAIEAKRAGWGRPQTSTGRLAFVSLQAIVDTCRDVFERARANTPGEFSLDEFLWGRLAGVLGDRDKKSASLRAVRYDDADGVPQGFVVYSIKENAADFTKNTADIRYLRAATDEAYAAIWRFLLELDLVGTVKNEVATADEPVLWMIRDQRAATVVLRDHHWLRILDVKSALQTRRYGRPGWLTLRIEDRLGFASGTYRLDARSDGSAEVEETDAAPDLSMDVSTLSALYLGAWRTSALAHAGRVKEVTPGALERFDGAFRADEAPALSFWY
ncbi:GNAT family N-acetyltransferase [Humibacter antri]